MKKLKGGATVEAACILPVIIFFFASVIWLIDIFRIHSEIGGLVAETGLRQTAYSYTLAQITENTENSGAVLIKQAVNLGWTESEVRTAVKDLDQGKRITDLTCSLSQAEEDAVSIKVSYRLKPYISLPSYKGILLTNSFYSKAFVGYRDKDSDEQIVYIVKNSEVYHTDRNCRSINVTVQKIAFSQIEEARNRNGAKYYLCSLCGGDDAGEFVYITPYGNRYHTREDCSSLEHQVYAVKLSEAGDRRKCYFCP